MIAELVAEVGPLWHARHQAKLASRSRKRAVGAGAKHRLVFVHRLLATLVHLRHAVTHDVLACWFGVDRSTITRAIGEVRPLLAERGCVISPGARLRTLAEVVDHLGTSGKTGIIAGTEIRVRRPAAGRKDRDKFISVWVLVPPPHRLLGHWGGWGHLGAVVQPADGGGGPVRHPRPRVTTGGAGRSDPVP
ncbi:transposase family protein [Streptomyces sp. NPDC016675]|uniref:helix-turn-helix domain-containing protein n=1 Tax=Streptomyces sp. NPDC016675 TaxID=3364970 RepID=UPI0036F66FEA